MILSLVAATLCPSSWAADPAIPNPEVNAQLWRLPADLGGTLWTDRSGVAGGPSAQLAVGWVHDPFVWVWDDTGERVPVVGDALGMDVVGAWGVGPVRVAVDLPVWPVASGAEGAFGGFGDLALDTKGRILDGETAPVGLALDARITLPTANVALPLGAGGAGWEIAAVADKRFGRTQLAANLGYRGVPDVTLDNVDVGDQLVWRLGAGQSLSDRAGVSLDVAGQLGVGAMGNAAGVPIEALLGGWVGVGDAVTVRGGVGRGLTRGIGASGGRAILAVAWTPSGAAAKATPVAKADPKPGKADADAAAKAEAAAKADAAAKAEAAAKADAAAKAEAAKASKRALKTASKAERAPTKVAAAGAPQPLRVIGGPTDLAPGIVHVEVTDGSGTKVDASWHFGEHDAGPIQGGLGMARVAPGSWVVIVEAPGRGPRALTVEVEAGLTSRIDVALTPERVRMSAEKLELLQPVRFDGAAIRAESAPVLDEVATLLKLHPEIRAVRIEGHVAGAVGHDDPLTASGKRAAAVKDRLVELGVAAERLVVAGYGAARPLDRSGTAEARAKNERVELAITERAETPPAP